MDVQPSNLGISIVGIPESKAPWKLFCPASLHVSVLPSAWMFVAVKKTMNVQYTLLMILVNLVIAVMLIVMAAVPRMSVATIPKASSPQSYSPMPCGGGSRSRTASVFFFRCHMSVWQIDWILPPLSNRWDHILI